MCFTVPSMDAFLAHLQAHQIPVLHAPRTFEHTTFTTVVDPDGRHVRVIDALAALKLQALRKMSAVDGAYW
jgi:hypothetical protein